MKISILAGLANFLESTIWFEKGVRHRSSLISNILYIIRWQILCWTTFSTTGILHKHQYLCLKLPINCRILSLLRNINPHKANGPDMITGEMLRICDDSVVLPLKIIFNNILETGNYPTAWKQANVTPVFKKNDKQLLKNYRPISLLPLCGKVFEKIVFEQLFSYLQANNLITDNQSGFKPGDSTTNQLVFLVNEIHECFEDKRSIDLRAVFLDISKAFDKVWHEGLLFKLKQNGINGNLLSLFQSYLQNRQQRVVIDGFCSEFTNVQAGVPQGSVLGPLLFLLYINDLESGIKSKIKFFADDTMLYSIVHDPDTSAMDLNNDLETIREWAHQWKMQFNPDPLKQAVEVIFSCKKKKQNHPALFFGGTKVVETDHQTHLGLVLCNNLSFKKHIREKIAKAKKILGSLKLVSKYLPTKALESVFKSFIRPHLDYCDIIFHEPAKADAMGQTLSTLMQEVERIQYQAGLVVSGAWKGTSRTKIYEELGWESLSDRRRIRRVLLLHKIVNNCSPKYLKDKLPAQRLQNDGTVPPIFISPARPNSTKRFNGSFFPDAISSWNSIIPIFQSMPSFTVLKAHLNKLFRPNCKSIFGIHNREGIRKIFQLRVGLSPLRSHKFRHNFKDTPIDTCSCGLEAEDTKHFLFSCPLYTRPRATLAASVVTILTHSSLNHLANSVSLYLYGHVSLSVKNNRDIIMATITYLEETKRFT